jgi:hypothetical protein
MQQQTAGKERPIFIVGRPRSGTTLMASLLDAHPRISILPIETRLFTVWGKFPKLDLTKPEDRQVFCKYYLENAAFKSLQIPVEECRSKIDSTSLSQTIRSLLSFLGETDAKWNKKMRWGEKSPRHFYLLKEVFSAFPSSQVILMVRDPRAILTSLLKTPWNRESPEFAAAEWNALLRTSKQWSSDTRVRTIFYEKLVTQTVPVLKDLCNWLGEDFHESMLDRSTLTHRIEKDRGWVLEHRKKTLANITSENTDLWKKELSSYHLRLTEHICGDQMKELGYEPVTAGLSGLSAIRYDLKNLKSRVNSRIRFEKKRMQSKLFLKTENK